MAVNNSSNLRQIDTDSGSAIVTAAVPNWEIVGGTNVTTSASGNTITINASGSSLVVQQVRAQSTTAANVNSTIGNTGTTPTTANTTLVISASITPTSSSNFLVFDFTCPFAISNDTRTVVFCLFQGTTFKSAFPFQIADPDAETANFTYYMQAPSTSATTFNVYAGTSGGQLQLLNRLGSALYGATGNTAIQFTITEISV